MSQENDSNQEMKPFKNGESATFHLSRKDYELLSAAENAKFEKNIAADGRTIAFRKTAEQHPSILKTANELYSKHIDLMKRLENL